MKLKHYFKRYESQIREGQEELNDLMCKTIVSKIMNCYGENYPAKMLPKASMTIQNVAKVTANSGNTASYIADIFQNLKLGEGNYLKYYFLDALTNQLYVDALINIVCQYYKRDIQFIFDFEMSNFTEKSEDPTIYVEYRKRDNEYIISSIVYFCPFNGEMEMEDFMSILLDTMYLLDPAKCLKYLTLKLANGVRCIPYSATHELTLVPCLAENYSETYRGLACNYRFDGNAESFIGYNQPILTMQSAAKATVHSINGDCVADVSQLMTSFM